MNAKELAATMLETLRRQAATTAEGRLICESAPGLADTLDKLLRACANNLAYVVAEELGLDLEGE